MQIAPDQVQRDFGPDLGQHRLTPQISVNQLILILTTVILKAILTS